MNPERTCEQLAYVGLHVLLNTLIFLFFLATAPLWLPLVFAGWIASKARPEFAAKAIQEFRDHFGCERPRG